jgi:hypothetical protein
VWGCFFLNLLATPTPIWHPHLGCWALGLGFEITLCALFSTGKPNGEWAIKPEFALQVLRIACFLLLAVDGLFLCLDRGDQEKTTDEESRPLLGEQANGSAKAARSGPDYGTTASDDSAADESGEDSDGEDGPKDDNKEIKEKQRKRLEEEGGWWGYLKGFGIFVPYLWPSKDLKIQGCLLVMAIGLVAQRVLTVLTPRQVGILTDRITADAGTGSLPWKEFLVWVLLRWLSSGAGYSVFTDIAKTQIQLWSRKRISELAFNHVMGLSMDFHSNKDTGEVIRAMQQAQSLTDLLELVLFDISPVFFDLVIALGYVTYLFNAYVAFILVVAGVIYTYLGVQMSEWIRPKRQVYREKDREQFKTLLKSVGNWETVS